MEKYINSSLAWALTAEAEQELQKLVMLGLDYDLAFVIIEEAWPEEEVFQLGENNLE